jgi:hypothetical protein
MTDAELKRNRKRLLLELEEPPVPNADKFRLWMTFRASTMFFPATALAALFLVTFLFLLNQPVPLDKKSLNDIRQFVSNHGNHAQLFQHAEEMRASQSRQEQLNGLLIVTMLANGEDNMLAAQGLVEDPRPEYRIYYLEYLLEHADEAYYNLDYLEELIDREEDPECLYLLGELLRLALSKQRDNRNYDLRRSS